MEISEKEIKKKMIQFDNKNSTGNNSINSTVRSNINVEEFTSKLKTCSEFFNFLVKNENDPDQINQEQEKLFQENQINREHYFFESLPRQINSNPQKVCTQIPIQKNYNFINDRNLLDDEKIFFMKYNVFEC